MKGLRNKRITANLRQDDYEKLLAIARDEDRLPGNLISWWAKNCSEAYQKVDDRGWARVKIKTRCSPYLVEKAVQEVASDIMRGQLRLERDGGGTA